MTQLGTVLSTGEYVSPISADSHIVEAPDCYTANIEKKYADTAPFVRRGETEDGRPMDAFIIDGMSAPVPVMSVSSAGRDPRESFLSGTVDDALQGGWDPDARILDQERDGIAAEMAARLVVEAAKGALSSENRPVTPMSRPGEG